MMKSLPPDVSQCHNDATPVSPWWHWSPTVVALESHRGGKMWCLRHWSECVHIMVGDWDCRLCCSLFAIIRFGEY